MNGTWLALGVTAALSLAATSVQGTPNQSSFGARIPLGIPGYAYRVKLVSDGIVVAVYAGVRRIGQIDAHWAPSLQGLEQSGCMQDFLSLGGQKDTPLLEVWGAEIEKGHQGVGVGRAMYEAMMATAFDRVQRPFFFIPMSCGGPGGGTSEAALRVWRALARVWPSAGHVLRVDQRPTASVDQRPTASVDQRPTASVGQRPTASVVRVSLGLTLRAALATDAAYHILDAGIPEASDWGAGGCAVLAAALLQRLPKATLYALRSPAGVVEHYLVRSGNLYYDADGASTSAVLLRRWDAEFPTKPVRLVQVDRIDARDLRRSEIACPPEAVDALVQFLKNQGI